MQVDGKQNNNMFNDNDGRINGWDICIRLLLNREQIFFFGESRGGHASEGNVNIPIRLTPMRNLHSLPSPS